jgi:branched-chain amino acid transport system substrate-binding protein
MGRSVVTAAAALVAFAATGIVSAQEAPQGRERYGGTPEEVAPFRGVVPQRDFFVEPQVYRGPGRDDPPPEGLTKVVLGLITPLNGYDAVAGRRILRAVEMAIDEANAAGGFGESKLPFALAVRDEGARWGQAGDAMVDLVAEDGAWAVLGGYEDQNSHVVTRVVLKAQVANVNTAGTDPTLTEHNIPWVIRNRPDDRQTAIRLLRKVYKEDGRRRAILFRANDRYGRTGVKEFTDSARRYGHPIPLETRYEMNETDWASRIERIRAAKPDAIVFWGRPGPTGAALRAVREAGIDLPCYGTDRLVDPRFLAAAGSAAEGFVFTFPFDPAQCGEPWETFRKAYVARTGEEPYADAAYAYDGARMVIDAIRKAGLNRPRILDALSKDPTYTGVTGTAHFDVTMNNVSKMTIGHVEKGRFVLGR